MRRQLLSLCFVSLAACGGVEGDLAEPDGAVEEASAAAFSFCTPVSERTPDKTVLYTTSWVYNDGGYGILCGYTVQYNGTYGAADHWAVSNTSQNGYAQLSKGACESTLLSGSAWGRTLSGAWVQLGSVSKYGTWIGSSEYDGACLLAHHGSWTGNYSSVRVVGGVIIPKYWTPDPNDLAYSRVAFRLYD